MSINAYNPASSSATLSNDFSNNRSASNDLSQQNDFGSFASLFNAQGGLDAIVNGISKLDTLLGKESITLPQGNGINVTLKDATQEKTPFQKIFGGGDDRKAVEFDFKENPSFDSAGGEVSVKVKDVTGQKNIFGGDDRKTVEYDIKQLSGSGAVESNTRVTVKDVSEKKTNILGLQIGENKTGTETKIETLSADGSKVLSTKTITNVKNDDDKAAANEPNKALGFLGLPANGSNNGSIFGIGNNASPLPSLFGVPNNE